MTWSTLSAGWINTRDWRDEPAPGEILPGDMAAQTGIKEGDAALPPISPPRKLGFDPRSPGPGIRTQTANPAQLRLLTPDS